MEPTVILSYDDQKIPTLFRHFIVGGAYFTYINGSAVVAMIFFTPESLQKAMDDLVSLGYVNLEPIYVSRIKEYHAN